MIKKILSMIGLKAVIKTLDGMIRELLQKSIRDPKLLAVLLGVLDFILEVVRKITNDDKDNTKEVKKVVADHLPELIFLFQSYINSK
jgi:H2-forming N5,N10-methylenetetrahydromethanopterin dehydrogenase-like enzyme